MGYKKWKLKGLVIILHEDMIDHRSYTHNLSSCEVKA